MHGGFVVSTRFESSYTATLYMCSVDMIEVNSKWFRSGCVCIAFWLHCVLKHSKKTGAHGDVAIAICLCVWTRALVTNVTTRTTALGYVQMAQAPWNFCRFTNEQGKTTHLSYEASYVWNLRVNL